MTISATTPPTPRDRAVLALARDFLTGTVIGGAPATVIVGIIIGRTPLIVAGLVAPVVYALLYQLADAPRRAREAAVVPRTALAMIEGLRAGGSETGDIPVHFDLTVAPDDEPAFRVEISQGINLVNLPDYRPRDILVVQYPPDRPWKGRIVPQPTPDWEERAATAHLDSAPESTTVRAPAEGCASGAAALLGLLLAVAAVLFLFRADLFDEQPTAPQPAAAQPSVSSTWSSTTVTSMSGTVSLGPEQSFLDEGELRRAVNLLTKDKETHQAFTLVVQERLLSIASPPGAQFLQFDVDALPYERFPALVEEARTTLGIHSAPAWLLSVSRIGGDLTISVAVSGPEGTAMLEADGQGTVVRRTPVR
ncbi:MULTISPECIES: hypothetical protein [Streptomyces]|uniref:hypothetical protein n=1 Tax=Streptomyces TaxID=1883 RepID=UPI0004AABA60|nr:MULTISPECIES: hypothetical protein [Streptomyces]